MSDYTKYTKQEMQAYAIAKNIKENQIVIVGTGLPLIGASLAKRALVRPLDSGNENEQYRQLERECLEQINQLNIGPMGLKGRTTALKVNIEWFPTHIAGMPVAVNINCHVTRHKKVVL